MKFTELSDVPGHMNIATVLEIVVDAPGSSDPSGSRHVNVNFVTNISRNKSCLKSRLRIISNAATK
jgi:hypothetical protein